MLLHRHRETLGSSWEVERICLRPFLSCKILSGASTIITLLLTKAEARASERGCELSKVTRSPSASLGPQLPSYLRHAFPFQFPQQMAS